MKNDDKALEKKELEKNITDKFMQAVTELGHDGAKLKREIKKAAKFVTKKIDRKIKAAKETERLAQNKAIKKVVPKAEKQSADAKKESKILPRIEKTVSNKTPNTPKDISADNAPLTVKRKKEAKPLSPDVESTPANKSAKRGSVTDEVEKAKKVP